MAQYLIIRIKTRTPINDDYKQALGLTLGDVAN